MSLKKKIILSFFISAFLIALLAELEYLNIVAIRKEIRFLELTNTVRSKSLQLLRDRRKLLIKKLDLKSRSGYGVILHPFFFKSYHRLPASYARSPLT